MKNQPNLVNDECRPLGATAQRVFKTHTGWLNSGATQREHPHAIAELDEMLVRTAPAWTGALKPLPREGQ
jgi:hypothetical protein